MPPDRLVPLLLVIDLVTAALLAVRAPRVARAGAGLAVGGLVAALVERSARSGHPPVFGTYETDLAETLVLLAAGLVLLRSAGARYLRPTATVAALTLLHTFLVRTEVTPLTISERSLWIDLHAALAWLAWAGCFHALFHAFGSTNPDDRGTRLLGWGFLALSGTGFVGAYYGTLLFATAWSWDPVQTLGLLTWLLYGVALHFRLFFGVTLRRMRYFLLVATAGLVLAGKLPMLLRPGQSFHVFELGVMAGEGAR